MTMQRDNVKAGLFVLSGIVLTFAVILALTDVEELFEQHQAVTVMYQLSDGLQGLKQDADVTLGDVPVGSVEKIEDVTAADTGRVIAKQVTISLPNRYEFYQDAQIELKVPLIGTGTKLNIRSVGQNIPYEPGMTIAGDLSPNPLAAQLVEELGIRDRQRAQFQAIVANIESITAIVRQDMPQISRKLKDVMTRAGQIMVRADESIDNLQAASADVRQVLADVRQQRSVWLDRVGRITESADQTISDVRDLVREKRPAIRQTIDNVAGATERFHQQTMDQVDAAIAKATIAMENLKVATTDVKSLVIGQRPVLERALANAQLTTDQLKLASIEIRRSPWRLLYEPDDKELETDNLYDAARSFALAAGTLNATAQSLTAYAAHRPNDTQQTGKMLDYLQAIFAKFEVAETSFWKALKESGEAAKKP